MDGETREQMIEQQKQCRHFGHWAATQPVIIAPDGEYRQVHAARICRNCGYMLFESAVLMPPYPMVSDHETKGGA